MSNVTTFMETSNLLVSHRLPKDSNHAAFFVPFLDLYEVLSNLNEKENRYSSEIIRKVYAISYDIIIRLKRTENLSTDTVYVKIMRETSRRGFPYLKIDLAETLNGQHAGHRMIVDPEEEPAKYLFKVYLKKCNRTAYFIKNEQDG